MSLRNQLELADCHQGLGLGLLGFFFPLQFVFSLLLLLLSAAPLSPQLCLSAGSARALQLARRRGLPPFTPTSFPCRGAAPHPASPGSPGNPQPCSSSPAEPGSPSFPRPFRTLRCDVPCAPSSAITACPARHRASLGQGEGGRWGVSHQRASRWLLQAA